LTGIELETPRWERSISFYVDHFGLEIAQRGHNFVSLKGTGHQTRQVTLVAGLRARLRGLQFEMHPSSDLRHYSQALRARGIACEELSPISLSFSDPDGTRIGLICDPQWEAEQESATGERPIFLSHVVVNSPDPARLLAFYVDTLGLRVSDMYEKGLLTFLRCDQPQHHCLGISPASSSGLNHFAMDCGSIDAVMMGLGRMKRGGFEPIWGPGRHRPGGNVFCYFEDPSGFVAEFTCGLLSIPAGDHWTPTEWPRTPDNANSWGTGGPTPRAIKLMSEGPPGE
jgi:catechol 2,3-dioxygenase-like lactoylglutathione lyase family enzyme